MRRTNHISLARVAANGAAPPGAQAWAVTSAFRRAPGRGCSRTGPATANADSPTEVAAHGATGSVQRVSDPVRRDGITWAAKAGHYRGSHSKPLWRAFSYGQHP